MAGKLLCALPGPGGARHQAHCQWRHHLHARRRHVARAGAGPEQLLAGLRCHRWDRLGAGGRAHARATEDYTLRQAMPYPQHQRAQCRSIKRSGAHRHTEAWGALFEEAGGWERPRVFAPEEPFSWRRTAVFEAVAAECETVRERVGLGDFSAFAKLELSGEGAGAFLDQVCANRPPRKLGNTCLTLLLNRHGTIEGEAVIARTGPETFYLVTGAPSERRVWDWLTLHCGVAMEQTRMANRTDEIGILTLAGPKAREVLASCTHDDVSNAALPWLKARHITVAGITCLALRLSFTGELAFELHAPNDDLGDLWQALWQAGEGVGIGAFGSKALDSLRLEKFYRGGHELANDASLKDVDLTRFTQPERAFVGKEAMLARAPRSVIALLALEGEGTEALIGEAIFQDGRLVGSVTSAAYGHGVGKSLAIGFLRGGAHAPGTALKVSVLGNMVDAEVLPEAPHDPHNARLRA